MNCIFVELYDNQPHSSIDQKSLDELNMNIISSRISIVECTEHILKMVASKSPVKVFLILFINHCLLFASGIIWGDDPPPGGVIKSVVFIDNNSLKNITDKDVGDLPIGCTGSVITRYHVITSGLCCNE